MIDHTAEHDRCALFASMGSGKTGAVLTSEQSADLLDRGPVLVLAPKRVAKSTWPGEMEKWDHLRGLTMSAIVGTAQQRRDALKAEALFYTCNYDNLPWLVEQVGIDDWPFKTVILDELTRVKNHRIRGGGSRAKALSRVIHGKTERVIGLTGTPAPNGYKDLWGQIWMLDKGERLGRTYEAYIDRWFRRKPNDSGYGSSIELMPYSEQEINARIADICRTIDPRDYGVKIDEPIDTRIEIELPFTARRHYREMEKKFFTELAGHEIEAANAGVKSMKLLQFASGAVYTSPGSHDYEVVHDAKIDALGSILEEANGMPVLLAYHFDSDVARIKKAFPFARVLDDRRSTEDDWNEGRIPLLLAHPASAGHGLNLQYGGNIIVYFSHWWDLETHEQILERIGPMRQMQAGLDRPVYRYFIVAKDTVDEDVLLRHASKRSVQSILLEAMKKRSLT